MSDHINTPDLPRTWALMFHRYFDDGWSPTLLTFMFDHMPGGRLAIRAQQRCEVEQIYGRAVTRIVRRPASPCNEGRLPVWLCAPDFPIFKHERQALRDVTINGGQHIHSLAFIPPGTRLSTSFVDFVEARQGLLVDGLRCLRVHAEPVHHNVPRTFGYVLKNDAREPDDEDGFFILPRSLSEVRDGPVRVGRNSSLYGGPSSKRDT